MMKLKMSELVELGHTVPVTIHSLDRSLYQLTAAVDGKEHLVVENSGQPFRTRSLQKMREILGPVPVASITLRQQSAYDEMIGQPTQIANNVLKIRLPQTSQKKSTINARGGVS